MMISSPQPTPLDAIPNLRTWAAGPAHISTSYVEHQNSTAFGKKLENLKAALALHFAHYTLVRIHRSLRVTLAMAAGVTDRV